MNKKLAAELENAQKSGVEKYKAVNKLINDKQDKIKPVYESVWANNDVADGYFPGKFAYGFGELTFKVLTEGEEEQNKYTKAITSVAAVLPTATVGAAGLIGDAVVTTMLTLGEVGKAITHLPNILYRSIKNRGLRRDIAQLKESLMEKKTEIQNQRDLNAENSKGNEMQV